MCTTRRPLPSRSKRSGALLAASRMAWYSVRGTCSRSAAQAPRRLQCMTSMFSALAGAGAPVVNLLPGHSQRVNAWGQAHACASTCWGVQREASEPVVSSPVGGM